MKNAFKSLKEIWKAWFGVVLICLGLQIVITDSNYWMLILCVIGLMLFYVDRNKLKNNERNKFTLLVTIITLAIVFMNDILNHFF